MKSAASLQHQLELARKTDPLGAGLCCDKKHSKRGTDRKREDWQHIGPRYVLARQTSLAIVATVVILLACTAKRPLSAVHAHKVAWVTSDARVIHA